MQEVGRLTIKVSNLRGEATIPLGGPLRLIADQLLAADAVKGKEFRESLEQSEECTVVYYGCGSCENGGARVEYYCSSSGGSTPDYVTCEPC